MEKHCRLQQNRAPGCLTEDLRYLSSAQVLPEWINRNPAANAFASNGDNPLNFVSHSRGSVQLEPIKLAVEQLFNAGAVSLNRVTH